MFIFLGKTAVSVYSWSWATGWNCFSRHYSRRCTLPSLSACSNPWYEPFFTHSGDLHGSAQHLASKIQPVDAVFHILVILFCQCNS